MQFLGGRAVMVQCEKKEEERGTFGINRTVSRCLWMICSHEVPLTILQKQLGISRAMVRLTRNQLSELRQMYHILKLALLPAAVMRY